MACSPLFKTIGILGGMGAEAGIELARRLVEASGARTDSEQIPCLLYTNPCIPDRPTALLRGGPSPVPELVRSLRVLEAAGAELLALPCNTAHAWYDDMQAAVGVPIVHMIRTMARAHPRELGTEIGVLCTSGLSAAGVYQRCCAEADLRALMPTDEEQELYVMRAIYGDLDAGFVGLKGSNKSAAVVQLMEAGAHRLIDRGATALWLACTEISLIKAELSAWSPVPVVDAMDALVAELVRLARR
jgi:aspartate racemase